MQKKILIDAVQYALPILGQKMVVVVFFHKYFMYRGGSISCADICLSGTYFSKYPPFSSHAHATPFLQVR